MSKNIQKIFDLSPFVDKNLDILRDEGVDYANRLNNAGVRTELHVYPGAFHGHFGVVPEASISQRTVDDIFSSVKRVFCS